MVGGVGPQTTQAMGNIAVILEEAGSSIAQIAKCIVYLTDMDDFATMNEAWIAVVGPSPLSQSNHWGETTALGAVVEIECTAVR